MTVLSVSLAVALTGALAVVGKTRGPLWLHWVAKPLPLTLLICAVATGGARPELRAPLLAALGASLVGDVALMWRRGFVLGLVSFLLAHLAYLVALGREHDPWATPWWAAGLVAAVALTISKVLWPHLGRLRLPVALYVLALAAVAAALIGRLDDATLPHRLSGAAGGVLFLAGDALLALRRFAGIAVPYGLELGSYFAAQALITYTLSAPALP